jgi:nitroreductase/NAD-dependent dihydropyrimidine dehydrogenase PreA subunit
MFTINKNKCIKCGECEGVCPFTCISMDNGYPEMKANKGKACIKCLHCASICPTEALDFENMPCDNNQIQNPGENIYYETKNLMLTRRSKRNFTNEQVPKEVIEEIIRISDFAPSAKNQHPQNWVVVHEKMKVARIMELVVEWVKVNQISMEILSEYEDGNNIVTFDAPHLVFACAPREGKINPYTDTTIALTDIDLLFHAKGIGACWAGYLTRIANASKEIKDLIGIVEGMQIFGTLAFGYSNREEYLRLPNRVKSSIEWK